MTTTDTTHPAGLADKVVEWGCLRGCLSSRPRGQGGLAQLSGAPRTHGP
jgi:hypothetical protein